MLLFFLLFAMGEGWIDPNDGDPKKNYPGEITDYVLVTCIVAAMGGLIFGYDIGISGKQAFKNHNIILSVSFFLFFP